MADEYMNDSGLPEAPTPAPEGKEDEGEGATALIPKTLLGGKEFKPGDEVVLQIVHEYEDEVEVKYASEKPESAPAEKPATTADEDIDMMAAGKGY